MSLEQSLPKVRQSCLNFWADEGGLTAIEYGLILGFISFAIIGLLSSMGDSVNTAFTNVNSDLETTIDTMEP